jgi:hypothetical protein
MFSRRCKLRIKSPTPLALSPLLNEDALLKDYMELSSTELSNTCRCIHFVATSSSKKRLRMFFMVHLYLKE